MHTMRAGTSTLRPASTPVVHPAPTPTITRSLLCCTRVHVVDYSRGAASTATWSHSLGQAFERQQQQGLQWQGQQCGPQEQQQQPQQGQEGQARGPPHLQSQVSGFQQQQQQQVSVALPQHVNPSMSMAGLQAPASDLHAIHPAAPLPAVSSAHGAPPTSNVGAWSDAVSAMPAQQQAHLQTPSAATSVLWTLVPVQPSRSAPPDQAPQGFDGDSAPLLVPASTGGGAVTCQRSLLELGHVHSTMLGMVRMRCISNDSKVQSMSFQVHCGLKCCVVVLVTVLLYCLCTGQLDSQPDCSRVD
jgi:hypothetical protein